MKPIIFRKNRVPRNSNQKDLCKGERGEGRERGGGGETKRRREEGE